LAEGQDHAPQNHADVIGCALFQHRDDVLATFAALGEDDAYRTKLGKINSPPFSDFAAMKPEDRKVALTLASLAMNRMIEAFAHVLGVGTRTIPGGYCVDYRIESRLVKIVDATEDGVQLANAASCVIAGDDQDVLLHSFNRWLNAFDSGK